MRHGALLVVLMGLAIGCGRDEPKKRVAPPPASEAPALHATDGAQEWRVTDKDLVLRLQARLQDLGIYLGPIDGRYRDEMRSALEEFQAARGLTASGKLDAATADALGLRPADVRKPSGAGEAASGGPAPAGRAPGALLAPPFGRSAPATSPRRLPSVARAPGGAAVDEVPPREERALDMPAGLPGEATPAPMPVAPVQGAPPSSSGPVPKPGI